LALIAIALLVVQILAWRKYPKFAVQRSRGMAEREVHAALEALTETIDYELRAQLALAEVQLDRETIAGIASMVAYEVLTEFVVTPRAKPPQG
jgi:hypothetical protein